jgi:hypothetical protein
MGAPYSKDIRTLDQGGDRRTVTATYRYGDALLTLVAQTKHDADRDARKRWGEWDGVPSYSTPRSIFNDLTGDTARRKSRVGMYGEGRTLSPQEH